MPDAAAAAWFDAAPPVAPPSSMMLPTRTAAAARANASFQATTATVPSGDDDQSRPALSAPSGSSSAGGNWYDMTPPVAPPRSMVAASQSSGGDGSTWRGMWLNANAGIDDLASTVMGAPGDIAGGIYNMVAQAGNAAGAPRVESNPNPPLGSDQIMGVLEPDRIVPHGFSERAIRSATGAIASLPLGGALGGMAAGAAPELGAAAEAALPGAAGPLAGRVVSGAGRVAGDMANAPTSSTLLPVTTGAITGQAAEDASPDWAKPYANLAGNLIGGGIGGLTQNLGTSGYNAAVRAGGGIGIGRKLDVGGVRATATQADNAAQSLMAAAGPDAATFRDALNNAPEQLVPGSQPTTAQMAPVPGIVDLENAHRVATPAPFNARAIQQNAARIGAVDSQAPADANPLTAGQYFTQQLDALRTGGAADVAQRQAGIQGQTGALGGTATPDDYGLEAAVAIDRAQSPGLLSANSGVQSAQAARDAAVAGMGTPRPNIPGGATATEQYGADAMGQLLIARQQQAQQVNRLKAAINPNGDAGINTAPVVQQVQQVYQGLSRDAAQPAGEEAAILQRVNQWPNVVPLDDLFALRERVGDAISTEVNAAGKTTTAPARRLMGVKTAIDQGLQNAVDQQAQVEAQQVAAGQRAPGDTIDQRIQSAAQPVPTQQPGAPPATGTQSPIPQTGTSVYTPAGRAVGVNYEVANLPDLVASHTPDFTPNPAFPPELQPRDRSRPASQIQVANMANNLQPERLGASPSAGEGAPIVGPDNVVESGNGRTLALQQAYAANGPQADAYRQFLQGQGLDTSGVPQPVLIRRRVTPLSDQDRVAFTQEANASPAAATSATERAMQDGGNIPDDTLALQQPGDLTSAANRDFVRSYIQNVPAQTEQALYSAPGGGLSLEGQQRIRNALLARAYNNPNLVNALAETGDPNIAAFGGALTDSAGPMARLASQIQNGAVDRNVDLSHPISEAVATIQRARQSGIPIGQVVNQSDAFGSISPAGDYLLRSAYGDDLAGRISRQRIGKMLSFYADEAGKQTTGDRLFGQNATAQEILAQARAKYGTNSQATGPSLADDAAGPGNPARGQGGGQPPADANWPTGGGGGQGAPATPSGPVGQPGQAAQPRLTLPRSAVSPGRLDRLQGGIMGRAGGAPLRPLNADELAAYRSYKTSAQQLADTFDNRRVGEVMAPGDYRTGAQVPSDITRARGGFNTSDAEVMSKFWNEGATQAQDVRDFRAAGGSPRLLQDYATDDLRNRAIGPDGSLNLQEYAKWRRDHASALSAFPEIERSVGSVATAQRTLEARQAQLAAVQQAHPLRDVTEASQLLGRYWQTGDQGADGIRRFMRDSAGTPDASHALDQYAVYRMRTEGGINPDGTVDPKGLARFRQNYALALSQRPELSQKLSTLSGAQNALDQASAAHAQAVRAYEDGVAKHFINDDPMRAVGKAFGSGNPTETFGKLVAMTSGNADARNSLKRATVDYILQRMNSLTPAGATDLDFMKVRDFRKFIDQNKAPLRTLFSGQGLQNFEMVAADLRRTAQRAAATPGSDTAQKLAGARRHGTAGGEGHSTVMSLIGEKFGEVLAHATGLGGLSSLAMEGAGVALPPLLKRLGASGITTKNDLLREAMLHPEVARQLAARVPANGNVPAGTARRIAAALVASSALHRQQPANGPRQ